MKKSSKLAFCDSVNLYTNILFQQTIHILYENLKWYSNLPTTGVCQLSPFPEPLLLKNITNAIIYNCII